MKTKHLLLATSLVLANVLGTEKSFSQCSPPTSIDKKSYCANQQAEIKLTDANTNAKYEWFLLSGTSYQSQGYGIDGKGRQFFSPTFYPAGSGTKSFYYQKQEPFKIGPDLATLGNISNGTTSQVNPAVLDYSMTFDSEIDFILDTVSVVVEMRGLSSKTYKMQMLYKSAGGTDSIYSDLYSTTSAMWSRPIGFGTNTNLYVVKLPVKLLIKKGNGQKLKFKSSGSDGVEGMYWWEADKFKNTTYLKPSLTTGIVVYNSTVNLSGMKQPLIFDWKISTKCDYVKVDVTETSSGCCVKPGSDFSLSSSKLIANPTDYPVTLSASGTSLNPSLFYQWLDGNGTIVASGVGKNTYSTSTDGTYTLRVAQNSSFISNNSCISEKAVIQQKRELFAPKDTTICLGESLTMMASGGLGNFTWSSSDPIAQAALSSKNSMVTTISGLPEGTYKFVVKADVALFNAVTDGTFASFDTRINDAPPGTYSQTFSTKYKPKPKPDTWANGQYRVESTKITAWSSTWCDSPTDNFYSNVPGDNFFYSDAHGPGSASGTATANTVQYALDNFAWQQANKPVIPNVNYKFKMKLANWSGGAPPDFKLLINGEELDIYQVGNSATKTKTFTATDKCIWYNVEAIWNSGSSTSATLTVAEVGRTDMGHEFAMDDISFGTDGIQTDTITVKVTNCNTVTATATPNTVCTGGTVNLSATANRGGYIIKWTPATDLTNANTATPTAKPMTPGAVTYSAEARFPKTKLFANSNFELGNTDVTSTLTFNSSPGSIMNGQYSITNGETKVYHPARNTGVTDHTSNTSTGRYMIAIVDVGAERTLLSKTISVVKDSSYSVSLWALSLNLNPNDQWSFAPVNVQIKVGGTVVKSVSNIPFNSNTWVNLDYAWTATATGSVTVAIVSPAAAGGQGGASAIGLDDVNIYQLGFSKTSSVTVNVTSCCNKPASVNITNSTQPIDLCQGGNTTLTGNYVDGGKTIANGGMFYVWYKQGSAPSSTASYTAISGTGTVTVPNKTYTNVAPTDAGTYVLRVQDGNDPNNAGCYTEKTVQLNVSAFPAVSITGNSSICVNSTTTLSPTTGGTWKSSNSLIATVTDAGVVTGNFAGSATFTFTLANTTNCSNTTSAVTIKSSPSAPTVPTVAAICSGNTATLNKTTPVATGTYFWYTSTTGGTPKTNPFTTPTLTANTIYYLIDSVTTTGCKSARIPLTVNVKSAPSTPTAPTLAAICSGSTATLNKTTPAATGTYFWYTSSTGGTPQPNPFTTPALTTNATYYLIDSVTTTGCKSARTLVNVNVNTNPPTPTGITVSAICSGNTATLNKTTPAATGTYFWYTSSTGGTPQPNPFTTPALTANANYYLIDSVTTTGCKSARTTVNVSVNPGPSTPTISVNPNKTSFCAGDVHNLTASSTVTSGTISYQWSNASSSTSNTATGSTNQGTFTYDVVAIANGCTSSKSTQAIVVNALPVVGTIGSTTNLCEGDARTLTIASSKATSTYTWTLTGTGVSPSNGTGQTLAVTAGTGNISVTVTEKDANGCTSATAGTAAINIDKKPTVATSSSFFACAKDPVSATGNQPTTGSGKWVLDVSNTTSGYSIDNLNLFNSNISKPSTPANGDKLTATWEISNGVCAKSTSSPMVVTFNALANPTVELNVDNSQICEGGTVIFNATGSNTGTAPTYSLFNGSGTQVGSSQNPTGTGVNTASFSLSNVTSDLNGYYVELTSNSTCATVAGATSSTKSVSVDKNPEEAVITTPNGTKICDNTITLTAQAVNPATTVGSWSYVATGSTASANIDASTGAVTSLTVGSAKFRYTTSSKLGVCSTKTTTVDIVRSDELTTPGLVSSSGKYLVCKGGKLEMVGNTPNTGNNESSSWTWSPNTGVSVDTSGNNDNTSSFTFSTAGTYNVAYTISHPTCGRNSVSQTVTVIEPAAASISAPLVLNTGDSKAYTFSTSPLPVAATAPNSGYTGTWTLTKVSGIGTHSLSQPNSSETNGVSGMEYDDKATLTWTVTENTGTCTSNATATLNIERKNITEARAKDDTLCFSAGIYTQTPMNQPNFGIGEQGEWVALGTSPTPASGTTLSVTFTAPGDYSYTYKIYNPGILDANNKPIESANTYTIRVDAPVTTSVAGTGGDVCTQPYALSANLPDVSKGEKGLWTATGLIFSDVNSNTSNVSGMIDGNTYPLTWTISSKYGKCPNSDSQLTLNKLKDITKARITTSITDFCANTTFSLQSQATDVSNKESGEWTSDDLAVPAADKNATTLNLSGLSKGTYKLKWITSSTLCPEKSADSVTLRIDVAPTLSGITGNDPTCEGSTGKYTASGVSTEFAFPHTYSWSTSSASLGNPTRTFVGSSNQSTAEIRFESSPTYLQDTDSATVILTVSNNCGSNVARYPMNYRLKPRAVSGNIVGPPTVCSSQTSSLAYGIAKQANTDSYAWSFDGISVSGTGSALADSAKVPSSIWSGYSTERTVDVIVTLSNSCGTGAASTPFRTTISKANALEATLTARTEMEASSVQGVQRVCLNTQNTVLKAANKNLLVGATYRYFRNGAEVPSWGNTDSALVSTSTLSDRDELQVTVSSSSGCFTGNGTSPLSNTIIIDGYDTVRTTLVPSAIESCEDSPISITVPVSKGNTSYEWVNDKNVTVQKGTSNTIVLDAAEKSGEYRVSIANAVCPTTTSKPVKVRLYQKPSASFATDPLVIIYSEGIKVPMPVSYSRYNGLQLTDSLTYIAWNELVAGGQSRPWISENNKAYPVIIPEKVETDAYYTLELGTGKPGGLGCRTQASLKLFNTLPLSAPNAFTPNGDGLNDTWKLVGVLKYSKVSVRIFNRWGAQVFQDLEGYKVPWDGSYNGTVLPAGTYYYLIELSGSPDNSDQTISGPLTIIQ